MSIVDPMHNLYLGSSKRMMHLWREQGLIDDKAVEVIQNRVNSFSVPPSITRIPHKIASSFPSLTTDQLRVWTNIYSLLTLHDILQSDHLECWRHFVLASRIFAKCSLSNNDTSG